MPSVDHAVPKSPRSEMRHVRGVAVVDRVVEPERLVRGSDLRRRRVLEVDQEAGRLDRDRCVDREGDGREHEEQADSDHHADEDEPAHCLRLRVERLAQALAELVEGEDRDEDHQRRQQRQPHLAAQRARRHGGVEHAAPHLRQQVAPARRRQFDPDPEERDAGLEQDVHRDQQRRVDDRRRQHVRDDVLAQDVRVVGADHLGRVDELTRAQLRDLRTDDARWVEPRERADQDDQREDPLG